VPMQLLNWEGRIQRPHHNLAEWIAAACGDGVRLHIPEPNWLIRGPLRTRRGRLSTPRHGAHQAGDPYLLAGYINTAHICDHPTLMVLVSSSHILFIATEEGDFVEIQR
jgi:hypothetical protein